MIWSQNSVPARKKLAVHEPDVRKRMVWRRNRTAAGTCHSTMTSVEEDDACPLGSQQLADGSQRASPAAQRQPPERSAPQPRGTAKSSGSHGAPITTRAGAKNMMQDVLDHVDEEVRVRVVVDGRRDGERGAGRSRRRRRSSACGAAASLRGRSAFRRGKPSSCRATMTAATMTKGSKDQWESMPLMPRPILSAGVSRRICSLSRTAKDEAPALPGAGSESRPPAPHRRCRLHRRRRSERPWRQPARSLPASRSRVPHPPQLEGRFR